MKLKTAQTCKLSKLIGYVCVKGGFLLLKKSSKLKKMGALVLSKGLSSEIDDINGGYINLDLR